MSEALEELKTEAVGTGAMRSGPLSCPYSPECVEYKILRKFISKILHSLIRRPRKHPSRHPA